MYPEVLYNIVHGQITLPYIQHILLITKIIIGFPNNGLNIKTIVLFHCNFFSIDSCYLLK